MTYSDDVLGLNPELMKEVDTKPASKYKNVRTEAKGLRFDSGHEAAEISKLIVAEEHKAGVFGLRLQVRFPLPGGIIYVADAVYLTLEDGVLTPVVYDCKGYETQVWKVKRKLFREMYGIDITVG